MTDRDATDPSAARSRLGAIGAAWRERGLEPDALAAFAVPAALILYLALSNGGYGIEARSVVGIVSWLVVALGCLLSVRPTVDVPRASIPIFALLAAFAAWTALSFAWTENDERTAVESARVLTYLGVFALALGLQRRGNARFMLAGITIALTVVCGLALLSRLEPHLFPERRAGQFIPVPEIERRLAYPLNYSGGIATLVTMLFPLLMLSAWSARSSAARGLAAAALPMAVVTLWLTGSGLILAVSWIGLVVFLILSDDRLPKLATLAAGLLGGALLCFAVVRFEALDRGLPTPEALEQGDQLLVLTVAMMLAVGFAHRLIFSRAQSQGRPSWALASQTARRLFGGMSAAALAVIAILAVSGALDSAFDRFRSLSNVPADASRLAQVTDIGSSGRYQQWQASLDAASSEPLTGIGAGTFEFWWARDGSYSGFVRDAHSLYLETLGELGIPGFLLIGAFVAAILTVATRRAIGDGGTARTERAGVAGALAAFAAAAGVDWMWELGVLPVVFVLLAAVAVTERAAGGRDDRPEGAGEMGTSPLARTGLIAASLVAVALIGLPALSEYRLETSKSRFDAGDFPGAYESARSAQRAQPFAASPRLQQALVLEQTGQIEDAVDAARAAVARAPTDWRPRLILSRLEQAAGDLEQAAQTYEQARGLNPGSAVFAE